MYHLVWATGVMHHATISKAARITFAIFQFPPNLHIRIRSHVAIQIVLKMIPCPTSNIVLHIFFPFIIVFLFVHIYEVLR